MADIEKQAKAERIEIRVTPEVKALLAAAACNKHTTISEFLIRHGIEAAEQVLVPKIFYATEKGWETVQKLLAETDDVAPSEELITFLKKFKTPHVTE